MNRGDIAPNDDHDVLDSRCSRAVEHASGPDRQDLLLALNRCRTRRQNRGDDQAEKANQQSRLHHSSASLN